MLWRKANKLIVIRCTFKYYYLNTGDNNNILLQLKYLMAFVFFINIYFIFKYIILLYISFQYLIYLQPL